MARKTPESGQGREPKYYNIKDVML